MTDRDLLQRTLAAAEQDRETVKDGAEIVSLLDGMSFHDSVTHYDDRGSVTEIYDPRWNWHPDPMVFCYRFTIAPGMVKGWGLHKEHEDRYFVMAGKMELVAFDPRPESSTYGRICKVVLSGDRPRLVNIPRNVWHADRCLGTAEVQVINFPTIPYNHAKPDKYRLPLDTDLIPYDFGDAPGW